MEPGHCQLCGHQLQLLRQPLKRLRWTRYWWKGLQSLFSRPLRICRTCGAIYTSEGQLLAAGAVQTEAEQRLDLFRRDMAYLRDSFGGVIIASELAAIWMIAGADAANVAGAVLAASVGAGGLFPFVFFARKVRKARKELRQMKEARLKAFPSTSE